MTEKSYIGINKLDTADKLSDKRKKLEMMRMDDVRDWALNRAFYKGNQWCDYDPTLGQVIKLSEESAKSWKVRLTANQIQPGVQHYVAQMTKTWPTIYATPDSGSERDRHAADMATRLFEFWEDEFGLRAKIKSGLTHAQLSQGYALVTWDAYAGKALRFLLNPQTGQPITDDEIGDLFRNELRKIAEEKGLDPQEVLSHFEKTVYVGDIKIEIMPGENVLLDPTASNFSDCQWAICRHAMSPEDVKARFKIEVEPDSSPVNTDVSLYINDSSKSHKTTKNVYIGYFRPSPAMPKGRYVVWIEDPMKILVDEKWPYPFDELPLVKFPGIERPDSAIDETRVTTARPLQKELNRFISQLSEFRNLTLRPQIITPTGSLRQRMTSEPGAVVEFTPINGLGPEWRPVPNIGSGIYNELSDIQQRIDRVFNRMPSSRDTLPARVDAGYSIELIQEAIADQMSTEIQGLEDALVRMGTLMVKLAQKYYIEPRLLKIKGSGGSVQVKKFMNADLEGGFTFNVESGTGLPRSRAGRQQRIMEIAQAFPQLLPPNKVVKYLEVGDLKGIEAMFQADEDQAYREHEKLLKGEPIFPPAVQQAMMVIQSGVNPQTQNPITPEEAQQMLKQAVIQPVPVVNPEAHIEVHDLLIKSPEFEQYPPDAQERFVMHRMAEHQMMLEAILMQAAHDPKVAPKVSLNARSTVSAPVMSKILGRAGIETTPEEVAEPPLETAIYDSMDKVDTDSAGNDQLDPMEQMFTMQQQEDAHMLNVAKAQQTMALAQQKHDLSMQMQLLQASQAEEMHQAKVVQAKKPKTTGGGSK